MIKWKRKTSIAVELSAAISGQSFANNSWLRYTEPGRLGWSKAEKGPTHMIKPEIYSKGNSSKYRMFHRRKIPAVRFSRRKWAWTLERIRLRHWEMPVWRWRRGDGGGLGELLSVLPSLRQPLLPFTLCALAFIAMAVFMAMRERERERERSVCFSWADKAKKLGFDFIRCGGLCRFSFF